MAEKNINNFSKGIDSDASIMNQPENSYRNAVNILNYRSSSGIQSKTIELSTKILTTLPVGFKVIGQTVLDNIIILFLVNETNTASKIGIISTDTNGDYIYTSKIDATGNELNLHFDYPVSCEARRMNNGHTFVYYTSLNNPPSVLDLDSPPDLSDLSDKSKLIPNLKLPFIDFDKVEIGGKLSCGVYQFTARYVDVNGNVTTNGLISQPIPIVDDNENSGATGYDGGYYTDLANKKIKLTISNIDNYYPYIQVIVIRYTGPESTQITEVFKTLSINPSTVSLSLEYNGVELVDTITRDEIVTPPVNYTNAKCVVQKDNRIFFSNLANLNATFDIQKYIANKIKVGYHIVDVPYITNNTNKLNWGFKDEKNNVLHKSYMRGEVYSFGIAFVFKNGSRSFAYHIPARTTNGSNIISQATPLEEYVSQQTYPSDFPDAVSGIRHFRIPKLNALPTFVRNSTSNYTLKVVEMDFDLSVLTNAPSPELSAFMENVAEVIIVREERNNPNNRSIFAQGVGNTVIGSFDDYDSFEGSEKGSMYGKNPIFIKQPLIGKHRITIDENFNTAILSGADRRGLGEVFQTASYATISSTFIDSDDKNANGFPLLKDAVTEAPLPINIGYTSGVLARRKAMAFQSPEFQLYPVKATHNATFVRYIGNLKRNGELNDFTKEIPAVYKNKPLRNFGISKNITLDDLDFNPIGPVLINSIYPIRSSYNINAGETVNISELNEYGTAVGNNAEENPDFGFRHYVKPATADAIEEIFGYGQSKPFNNTYSESLNLLCMSDTTLFNILDNEDEILTSIKYRKAAQTVPFGDTKAEIKTTIDNNFKTPLYNLESDNKTQYGSLDDSEYIVIKRTIKDDTDYSNLIPVGKGDVFITRYAFTNKQLLKTKYYNDDDLGVTARGWEYCETPAAGTFINGGEKGIDFRLLVDLCFIESDKNCDYRHKFVSEEGLTGSPYYPKDSGDAVLAWDTSITSIGYEKEPRSYNIQYSFENTVIKFFSKPLTFIDKGFYPTRTIYSSQAFETDNIDAYKIIEALNFYDLPKHTGDIINTFIHNNIFFLHTTKSLWRGYVNELTQSTTTSGSVVTGVGGIFSTPAREILPLKGGYAGTISQFGGINTPYGYVFPDALQGKIFILSGEQLNEMSLSGLSYFGQKYIPYLKDISLLKTENLINNIIAGSPNPNPDNPFTSIGYVGGYDPAWRRFMLTKTGTYNSETAEDEGVEQNYYDFTLGFSFETKMFLSFYSYIPNMFIAFNNKFLGIKNNFVSGNNYVFEHHVENHVGSYYKEVGDVTKDKASIEFVFNTALIENKTLDNVAIQMDIEDIATESIVDVKREDGDTIQTYSDYNYSGKLNLIYNPSVLYPTKNQVFVKNRNNEFRLALPLDAIVSLPIKDKHGNLVAPVNFDKLHKARVKGNYTGIKLDFDTLNNSENRVVLNYIEYLFRLHSR